MNKEIPKNGVYMLIVASFLLSIIFITPIIYANPDHISFHINVSVADGYFAAEVSVSGETVEPGKTLPITYNAKKADGSLYLDMGTYGSHSITFDTPLSSISIPVTGISGLASVNVDLHGSLEGDLSINGPGSLNTNRLSWNSWGKKSVTLDASDAKDGDTIIVTMNLEYTGNIGAHGDTMFGDVTLISDQTLPGIQGSNPIVHTVKVQKSGIIPGFETIAILIGLIIVTFIYWYSKKFKN